MFNKKKYDINKIKKCINLLHDDYLKNINVNIIDSKFKFRVNIAIYSVLSFFNNKYVCRNKEMLQNILNGNVLANLDEEQYINIYLFNCKNPDANKFIIKVLFHELRHIYQYNYKFEKLKKHFVHYDNIPHNVNLLEKDANKFAYRMYMKHFKCMEHILKK